MTLAGIWRHVKRGTTYLALHLAEVQAAAPIKEGERLIIYGSTDDGRVWARPTAEFHDGRFVPASDVPMGGPAYFQQAAQSLVAQAARFGVVVTIEQRPLLPLAMGHHETVVSTRPARGAQ